MVSSSVARGSETREEEKKLTLDGRVGGQEKLPVPRQRDAAVDDGAVPDVVGLGDLRGVAGGWEEARLVTLYRDDDGDFRPHRDAVGLVKRFRQITGKLAALA